tara:strand:- start:10 stop:207 length:198 start_codon:yes stop_codon:yes gene_type:complete
MNAARPKAALCDFKAPPLAKNDVLFGDAHTLQMHFAMPAGRMDIAEYRLGADHLNTRRVTWNDNG